MTKKIFIWVGHPKSGAFCEALADKYQNAAEASGAQVRRMNLSAMSFDLNSEGYDKPQAPLEPDLKAWQEAVSWADHLLFVHPYWWGAMPTKAKAVFDRALTPGFGFKYHAKGMRWDKLFKGKTADVIVTSDTPPLLDTFLYRKPARNVMKNQVLGFCGIKTKNNIQLGSVKTASKHKMAKWMKRIEKLGAKSAAA
ncbi:MAG: NAD(P)H-dependent oxidoreductase [Parvibaculaceae bacterium]|nr:NAD(P)H-dependent oxidoreductase [Parvibaculaceae bacterium]